MAGRLIHVRFRFPEGVLHLVGIYGVSSPTQTARKAWISAALAKELQRVLAECGNEAVLTVGDLNVVPEGRDRRTGRTQLYDDNESAPWRTLQGGGMADLWRWKMPESNEFTFVKDGQPCSRIDAAYGNRALLRWGDVGAIGMATGSGGVRATSSEARDDGAAALGGNYAVDHGGDDGNGGDDGGEARNGSVAMAGGGDGGDDDGDGGDGGAAAAPRKKKKKSRACRTSGNGMHDQRNVRHRAAAGDSGA